MTAIRRKYWLVLQRDDPDLCYSDPGYGDDLVVRAGVEALVRVYLGQWSLLRVTPGRPALMTVKDVSLPNTEMIGADQRQREAITE